jgi:uncharacterized protein (TIGR02145 family)
MIKKSLMLAFVTFALIINANTHNPTDSFQCGDPITDPRDGKIYSTVLIGNQCWMAENLNVGIMVSDFAQQDNKIIEKTCYDNDPANCQVYGGLYNWHEAMNWEIENQGICPVGWHLPSREDWQQLVSELGTEDAGQHMKVSKEHSPSWDGTNSSGFSALPAGVGHESHFGRIGKWGLFWSSTEADENFAWFAQLDNFWNPAPPKYKILYIGNYFLKENGFSVRCVREGKK